LISISGLSADIIECMQDSIAVITVVYNNYSDLDQYFSSFKKQIESNFRIYCVDVSTKPQKYTYPSFVKPLVSQNKGYAHGLHVGLHKALQDGHQRFVFMNNDTTVEHSFIKYVSISLTENPSSLIGGKIYYSSGYEYHKNRYSQKDLGHVLWYAGGIMDWDNAWATHRGVDEIDTHVYDTVEKTEFVTGCLMVFDKNLIEKAGEMDVSYFMYYEDADWCQQVLKAGCACIYDPRIVIWHKNAQSTGGSGSTFHQKYQRRNRLKFGLRYAPIKTKMHLLKNYFLSFFA